jgi:pantetheine-phosphate adenylyltransferase
MATTALSRRLYFSNSCWWPFLAILLLLTTAAAWALDPLIASIMHPIILEYPWPFPEDPGRREADSKRTVVLAGSYNPPHNGHLAMLEYLAQRYGTVQVVIGCNPNKQYKVSPGQRADLIRRMLQKSVYHDKIHVKVVQGYIWRTVKRDGAEIFFRGIRSWEKDGKEEQALQILNTWGPLVLGPLWWPLPTMFLKGKPEYNHVSSTLIRDLCQQHGSGNQTSKGKKQDMAAIALNLKELVPD